MRPTGSRPVAVDAKPSERPHIGKLIERAAVKVARSEIGNGESVKNNAGPDVERYGAIAGLKTGGSWCAIAVSYCFAMAVASVDGARLGFKLSRGAKRLTKNIGKHGAFITEPHVGAVICWHRGPNGEISWRGHVGIVLWVSKDGESIRVWEGNKGPFPAKCKIVDYRDGAWRRRLYKIATLIG